MEYIYIYSAQFSEEKTKRSQQVIDLDLETLGSRAVKPKNLPGLGTSRPMSQIDDRLEALEHIPTSRLKFGWSSQKVPGELLWSLLSGPGLIDI